MNPSAMDDGLWQTCNGLAVLLPTEEGTITIHPVEVPDSDLDRFLADAAANNAVLLEPVADDENLICAVSIAAVPCLRRASHAITSTGPAWSEVTTCWPHLLGAAARVLYGPDISAPRPAWN
jgi:hypothetical protein